MIHRWCIDATAAGTLLTMNKALQAELARTRGELKPDPAGFARCVFRSKSATRSDPDPPGIPIQTRH